MDETLCAYHEAGHAVVACLLGGRIESATIERDAINTPNQAGSVAVAWPTKLLKDPKRKKKLDHMQIQILLAGPVAEMIYRGDRLHPAAVPEWQVDWQTALELLVPYLPEEANRWRTLERVCVELHEQLQTERCWQSICEVAELLEAHETIDGDQVIEVVQRWM